jgi:hypothetical protein
LAWPTRLSKLGDKEDIYNTTTGIPLIYIFRLTLDFVTNLFTLLSNLLFVHLSIYVCRIFYWNKVMTELRKCLCSIRELVGYIYANFRPPITDFVSILLNE